MDLKTKKKYYNLCYPYESLKPDDKRNVDLDTFGEESGTLVRGINWVEMLLTEITLSDKPVYKLFTGHGGSGKTTEFNRLVKRLYDPKEGNLFPVLIDSKKFINLEEPIDVPDIIASIVYSTEKAIIQKKGGDTEKALDEGYFKRLWNFLNTELKANKIEFNIPLAGKLALEMKDSDKLRGHIRTVVASNFSKFIKEAKESLEVLNENVKKEFNRDGIIIIFDSLEKLMGTTDNWKKVLESAERVFRVNALHMRLPVHVLYTVPPALSTRITDIDFMPMIQVRDRNMNPNDPGLAAARELIFKRIPEDILKEMFGHNHLNRIDDLILCSGGYPREILEILRKVIAEKKHPLSDRAFKRIIAGRANQYSMVVTAVSGDMFNWLAKVAKTKRLPSGYDIHREEIDRMLNQHAILIYQNDDFWYDLHPAVYQIPDVEEAIQNLT